jgi:O-antigen/teichoic acid export membrane protein
VDEHRRSWDQRLLERLQRGNDRVAGPGWARLIQGSCFIVMIAFGVANISAAWVLWTSVVAFLCVLASWLLVRLRARRGRR